MKPVMTALYDCKFDVAKDELDTLAFYQRTSWIRIKLMQFYVATMVEDDEMVDEILKDIEDSQDYIDQMDYFELESWDRIKLMQLYIGTLDKNDRLVDSVLQEIGEYIRDYKIQHL